MAKKGRKVKGISSTRAQNALDRAANQIAMDRNMEFQDPAHSKEEALYALEMLASIASKLKLSRRKIDEARAFVEAPVSVVIVPQQPTGSAKLPEDIRRKPAPDWDPHDAARKGPWSRSPDTW